MFSVLTEVVHNQTIQCECLNICPEKKVTKFSEVTANCTVSRNSLFTGESMTFLDHRINHASITLNRYNEKKWNKIPATLFSEDNKYLYFTAETPGFSPFAITGKLATKENVVEILPEPETKYQENNTGDMAANIEHTPEQKEKTNGMSGFEVIYCIIRLLGAFRYRRR